MGADDQIVLPRVNQQIVNGNGRHVVFHSGPAFAAVQSDVDCFIGSDEQQVGVLLSSRMTLMDSLGKLAAIDLHDRPKSVVL